MCILFLAINKHPDYPLIVAANRDEAFSRPSQAMHFWPDSPEILAGRDTLKGGTWLGVNSAGYFCAVTNFRTAEPSNDQAKSRGELVHQYLKNETTEDQFITELQDDHASYNPFNLVFGGLDKVQVFSSIDSSLHHLSEGFHSLSNGRIDQHWPKMSSGVQRLTELISENSRIEPRKLNEIMRDETKADDHDLPSTGVSPAVEKHLSSIFIRGEDYGTRTTSYLLYSSKEIEIHETNYDSTSAVTDQQTFMIPTEGT
jgi:uncharacterized protein with NRDE domain